MIDTNTAARAIFNAWQHCESLERQGAISTDEFIGRELALRAAVVNLGEAVESEYDALKRNAKGMDCLNCQGCTNGDGCYRD